MKHLKMLGFLVLGAASLIAACQQQPADAALDAAAMSEDQKAIYAYGAIIGRQLVQQNQQLQFSAGEMDIMLTGLRDAATGNRTLIDTDEYEPKFLELAQARVEASAAGARNAGAEFLAAAAAQEGAVKTDSGLVIRTIKAGDEKLQPKASDVVQVHYHGTLPDGTVFDSSVERGEPAEFPLEGVIACWTEGVQKMSVGETAQLVCPPELAYGDRDAGPIPPGSTLNFEVQLLGIKGR